MYKPFRIPALLINTTKLLLFNAQKKHSAYNSK